MEIKWKLVSGGRREYGNILNRGYVGVVVPHSLLRTSKDLDSIPYIPSRPKSYKRLKECPT